MAHQSRNRTSRHHVAMRATLFAAVLLMTSCGSAGGSPSSSAGPSKVVVGTGETALGTVLVDGRGRTLYELTSDTPTRPACTGACLVAWPPVLVTAVPAPAAAGVSATFGAVAAAAGQQLSVNGHAVYTFNRDTASGQSSGQGIRSFGGTWWALDPTGAPITTPGAPASKPTSSSGDVRGY